MKRTNKIISLLLVSAMSVSLIAGCGKDDKSVAKDDGGHFVPTEELNLTVWNLQGTEHVQQETSTENIPKTWLEEQSKVKVGNIYGNDGGQWDSKLTRLIAGDNLPDMFYVAGGQGPAHFKKLKDAKALYPLTEELIKTYAPNVWSRVPQKCWEAMTAEDGQILGIPFGFKEYSENTHPYATEEELAYFKETKKTVINSDTPLHIRDDIAKKIFPETKTFDELCAIIDSTGKKLGDQRNVFPIKTTEDMIKMFRDIDALNLKENGRKVFALGYNGGDLWFPFYYLGSVMCGYSQTEYITYWNPNKKQIEMPILGEVVKESAKIQNEFIRTGIADPESLVQNSATFKENVMNGLYAVTSVNYAGGMLKVNAQLKQLGKDFRYIPLIVDIPEHEDYPLQHYGSKWTAAVTMSKTLDTEQVKQVLNWINIQFSDEFEEILWWGTPEDGLYTEENGVRTYVDDRFNKRYIDGDSGALSVADCKGIGSAITPPECEFYVLEGFTAVNNHWNPRVMRQINDTNSTVLAAFEDDESEPYIKRPQSRVYDAPYAKVEECVDFWAKRQQWEDPFKIALGADSEENFEKLWTEAENNLKSIVDVDVMCSKMTEIAREQAKELDIE